MQRVKDVESIKIGRLLNKLPQNIETHMIVTVAGKSNTSRHQ
jgi:hypothetical protein